MKKIGAFAALFPMLCLAVACGSSDAPVGEGNQPTENPAPNTDPGKGPTPDPGGPTDPPAPAAVKGSAVSRWFDESIGTSRIDLGSGPAFAITSKDGAFTLDPAPASYDLTLTTQIGASTVTDRFEGLSTRSPLLESGALALTTAHQATLSGTVPGIGATIPNGKALRVFARDHFGGTAAVVRSAGQTPDFTITPHWHGDSARTVTVYAEYYETVPAGGFALGFDGIGKVDVQVTDGQMVNDVSPALAAAQTVTLTGTFSPASFSGGFYAGATFGTDRRTDTYSTFAANPSSPFTILLPGGADTSTYVGFNQSFPEAVGGRRVDGATQSISFVVPEAPTVTGPADATAFAPEMTFSWDGPATANGKGVYRFGLYPKQNGSGAMYFVNTMKTSVTLPASFVPSDATAYEWTVQYYPDLTSVDGLVGSQGWSRIGSVWTKARTISVQ